MIDRIIMKFLLVFLFIHFGNSLKHSYSTKGDERSLIGPLGFPFGFLDSGHYDMSVYDFGVMVGVHTENENHDSSLLSAQQTIDAIDGIGFLLKKFEDESDFDHYMNVVQQNPSTCVFQSYLDENQGGQRDDDDRFQIDGEGEVLDAALDGIFLDMKPPSRWAPNEARVSYNFKKGEAGYYFLIFQICPAPKVGKSSTCF